MNKHIHRVIFSKARGQFVAVSETATSNTKGASGSTESGGGIVRVAATALAVGLLCSGAMAAPFGGQVMNGSASINGGGNLTTINQTSNRAIINWQGFGIGNGQTVQINQPGVNAALLNRVTGNLPTQIDGSLLANGKVFLINPNGIVVGANGLVNVNGGFVASTQNVADSAFMAGGALNFSGAQGGEITVLGRIESASGPITLIAPKLNAAAGSALKAGSSINLVAASDVTLSNGTFNVTPHAGDAGELTSAGALQAAQVQLAAVNNNLGALAINTSGTIRATGVQNNADGSIRIMAIGQGTAELHDATLTATNADGSGGKIDVTGTHTGLFGNTTLNASGTTAGGSIRVGGGFQGKEGDIANSQATYIDKGVKLNADATTQGNGGRVVVWADGTTRYNGDLSAKGAGTGKGGDAEVSGKGTLAFNGTADLRGGNDTAARGTLLLDPSDITISNALDTGGAVGGTYDPAASSNLNIGTLTTALQSADVTVKTSSGTGGSGDITIVDAIDFANPARSATLRLEADRNINVNAAISDTGGTGVNATSLELRAAQDVSFNAAVAVRGALSTYAGRDIDVNAAVSSTMGSNVLMDAASISPLTATGATSGWQSGTGAIRFGAGGSVSSTGASTTTLNSGKTAANARTDFTLSANTAAPGILNINGFDTVNLDVDRAAFGLSVNAATINVSAGTLSDLNTTLSAAGYDSNKDWHNGFGWQNQQGLINFVNPNVSFLGTGDLSLTSGLSGTNRNDFNAPIDVSGTRDSMFVQGFRDVTLNEAVTTNSGHAGIWVTGRNIQVDQSLISNGAVLNLEAGVYDTGATVANSYSAGGWASQPGLLRFANPATTTLTGGFEGTLLRSGVDYANNPFSANPGGPSAATSSGVEARVDLPTGVKFVPRAGDAMFYSLTMTGFRDVTLPVDRTEFQYVVAAQNITIPAAFTGVSSGQYLSLAAGTFSDLPASPNFPGAPALVSTAAGNNINNEGVLTRQGGGLLDLEAGAILL
ncbi:MAG: putative bpaA, partial [Variovorax sp.]|nr:putative bpaA [Variovorax sp.]